MCRKERISLDRRTRNNYVPYDALYSLCDDPVHVFLPPSRHSFGIVAPTLPDEMPVEFSPCEYFALIREGGELEYLRPENGHEGFYSWTFPDNGSGEMAVDKGGVSLRCTVGLSNKRSVAVRYGLTNTGQTPITRLYVNPCLRYQNLMGMRGDCHENVYVGHADGPVSIHDLLDGREDARRVLVLHGEVIDRQGDRGVDSLRDSLMASRHMNLVDVPGVSGHAVACERLDRTFSLGISLAGPTLGFFSRSEGERSGCMHVIPLVMDLAPGESRVIEGAIRWEDISAAGLIGRMRSDGGGE